MRFPIFLHKESEACYEVTVPDIPGCYSAGSTIDLAIENAIEVIECHVEGLLKDEEGIPHPKSLDEHQKSPELKNSIIAFVETDLSKLSGKAKRINITLPERLLKCIDHYTKAHGGNRSAFIADAALYFMADQKD